jgi:hypothetical protein
LTSFDSFSSTVALWNSRKSQTTPCSKVSSRRLSAVRALTSIVTIAGTTGRPTVDLMISLILLSQHLPFRTPVYPISIGYYYTIKLAMDIETPQKKRGLFTLEDSPFGHEDMVKLEAVEPSHSYLCLDLFHHTSSIKEEKMEMGEAPSNLIELNTQLGDLIG